MATYEIPYQNISVDVPDEGYVFRGVSGNGEGSAFVRYGSNLYRISSSQYPGGLTAFNSLPQENPSSEGLYYLLERGPGEMITGDANIFQKALSSTPTSGEVITQSINPDNPQGTIVTSSSSGQLTSSPSTVEQAAKFGVTTEQLTQYQQRGLPGDNTGGVAPQSTSSRTLPNVGDPIPGNAFGLTYTPEDIALLASTGDYGQAKDSVPPGIVTYSSDNPLDPNDPMAAVYQQLKDYLDKLQASGQIVNPNVQITPEKLAEFMTQARGEIQPYYSTQLKLATDDLLRGVGYSQEQLASREKDIGQQYQSQFRNLEQSSAEQGFAQSGIRQLQERQLAEGAQSDISAGRRDLSYNLGSAVGKFAQQFGTPGFQAPSVSAAPTFTSGERSFGTSSSTSPLYQLSPDVYNSLVGEQQFAERGAIQNRASQLEEAFRTNQAIDQTRKLVL